MMCSLSPLSGNAIDLVTIFVGFVAPLLAIAAAVRRKSDNVKGIAVAWLSYGFTCCPLAMIALNSVLLVLQRSISGECGPSDSASVELGVGGPTIAFSAGYAILHLTADLHRSLQASR